MRGKFQEKLLSESSKPKVKFVPNKNAALQNNFGQDKLKCIPLFNLVIWNFKFDH